VTQRDERAHWGSLYRLGDGEARHVADFYYDSPQNPSGIYISRFGDIYNWSLRSLAVLREDGWIRHEVSLDTRGVSVADTGEFVRFYCGGRIYGIGSEGQLAAGELPEPERERAYDADVVAVGWGSDRMLRWRPGTGFLDAWDMRTFESVPIPELTAAVAGSRFHYGVGLSDGSVILPAWRGSEGEPVVYVIDANGSVAEKLGIGRMARDSLGQLTPLSIHAATDGSLWLPLRGGGVARHKDGETTTFDWRDGLPMSAGRQTLEGPAGMVYIPSHEGIITYGRPQPGSGPLPDYSRWEEVRLAGGELMQAPDSSLWLFRADRQGYASRWDGSRWAHVAVPFDTTRALCLMTDDRGHLIVQAYSPDACYDISTEGVERYESIRDLLIAAVADGAARFVSSARGLYDCVPLDGGRLWYGSHRRVDYFDGERWDTFGNPDSVKGMFESQAHEVLFLHHPGDYSTYDRGIVTELDVPRETDTKWLLGPSGMQPYEHELFAKRPALYLPVRGRGPDGYWLLNSPADRRRADLSRYVARAFPAASGGFWVHTARVLGPTVTQCSLSGSPLAGQIRDLKEDPGHGLWLALNWTRLFFKDMSDFTITVEPVDETTGESLRIEARPTPADMPRGHLRLFWRLGDGEWRGGEMGGSTLVRFPKSGRHRIEVMGMCPQGGTTVENVVLEVTATVEGPTG
jgi:hypothetical protein